MADRLRVAEVFASFQGEGPAAGRSAGFLRLMGCNLSCAPCDTAYTWDTTRHRVRASTLHLTAAEILDQLPAGVAIYVLTGGEPLLQQRTAVFAELLPTLASRAEVHVETNGTIQPCDLFAEHITTWVVSPKLVAMPMLRPRQNPALRPFWHGGALGAHLKVVCSNAADVEEAVAYADSVGWPRQRVWVMPEGATAEALSQRWPVIAQAAIGHRINLTHRLHGLAGAR